MAIIRKHTVIVIAIGSALTLANAYAQSPSADRATITRFPTRS
jgi:hypothetical protein